MQQVEMLNSGDVYVLREGARVPKLRPQQTGQVEDAILDPVDGPVYRVWGDGYELITVYGSEIERP